MDDLISKQALKEALLERGFYPVIVKQALEDAPVVDAVPVKHSEPKIITHAIGFSTTEQEKDMFEFFMDCLINGITYHYRQDVPAYYFEQLGLKKEKHGRWEFVDDYTGRCTNCKEENIIDWEVEDKYCPNCGAKMDEENNND